MLCVALRGEDILVTFLLRILCKVASSTVAYFLFFFFFQAEDGIRDLTVTGVQTCALPISVADGSALRGAVGRGDLRTLGELQAIGDFDPTVQSVQTRRRRQDHEVDVRSEEHTSELQSQSNLVCRLLLEKKKKKKPIHNVKNKYHQSHHITTFLA